MTRLEDTIRALVELFEASGISYALMGGVAVRIHAIPRPTYDVDVMALIPRDQLPKFYEQLAQRGFTIPAAQLTGWIEQVKNLPFVKFQWLVGGESIDVDVFLAESAFQAGVLRRRVKYSVDGFEAWIVTAEDLILLKLLADRAKDRNDVGDVLFIQGDLDYDYMRHWARQQGTLSALESLLTPPSE